MNHRVELVLRDIDAVETAREIRILVAAQHVDLTDATVYYLELEAQS